MSIDIDVIYLPGANIEIRLSEKSIDFGSIELELVKRKQRNDANIAKLARFRMDLGRIM